VNIHDLCLHTDYLTAKIYRDRSGAVLPVSVIAKDDACQKFRIDILKGITYIFILYKTSDLVPFILVYRPPSNDPFTNEGIMLLGLKQ
jgi:hypothetical protein